MPAAISLWYLFALLFAERFFELYIAGRNRRILMARGGREFFSESYPPIVAMHLLFFACLIFESRPWFVPLDFFTFFGLAAALLLQAGRYWCIASLGEHWNTRIILVPGAKVVRRGPYRFLRHPNYLIVTLEFLLIPMLMRAPFTLLIFSLANLLLLRRRIGLEERALREHTDYGERFSGSEP